MLAHIKRCISQTAQRAALVGLGGVCLLAGVGFLTAAAFLYLLTQTDPIMASLIIGGAFSGTGLLLVGLSRTGASSTPAAHAAQATPPASTMAPVMLAFLDGLQQGMAARTAAKAQHSG